MQVWAYFSVIKIEHTTSIFEQADRPYVLKPCEKAYLISSDFALFLYDS